MKKIFCIFFALILSSCVPRQGEGLNQQIITAGEHVFPEGITVDKGETLLIEPGARLLLGDKARITVNGKIIARGIESKPIIFEGKYGYWRGIKINGLESPPEPEKFWQWFKEGDKEKEEIFLSKIKEGNIFDHCEFRGVSTEDRKLVFANKWKGAIEAYNTAIKVSNSKFDDILYIGGVLAKRSYVLIDNNAFLSKAMHKNINVTDNSVGVIYKNTMIQHREKSQVCADGIWMSDAAAIIFSNQLQAIGDDGIDTDHCYTVVLNNEVDGVWDDGIDVDNKSTSFIIGNSVKKSGENAILVSNVSKAILVDNITALSETGLALRNGARVAASGMDIENNEVGIMLFQSVLSILTKQDFSRLKEQLSILTQDEIFNQLKLCDSPMPGIPAMPTSAELINLLELSYSQSGDYWLLNKKEFKLGEPFKPLQDLFKTVDVLKLEYVDNINGEKPPLDSMFKNYLYLTQARVKNNGKDVLAFHNYSMQIDNTEFIKEEYGREVQKLCEKDIHSDLTGELDVTSVRQNAERIVNKMESLK